MTRDQLSRYTRLCARTIVVVGAASFVMVAAVILLPAPALAVLPFDPASVIGGEYQRWTATAQGFARTIYTALAIFELIAVAITTLLFRDNIAEFFATVGFKSFMGGLFFWLIANGPNLAQGVISWFSSIGQNQFGGPGGAADPYLLFAGVFYVANALFAAADLAHGFDQTQAISLCTPPLCTWTVYGGYYPGGLIGATLNGHSAFVYISQGIALMILMAAAAIILQFFVITIESFLVMSVGVLFIGFAGSRWTFSFSQGYFSYMINVGVKLMVTYIMLGVASYELLPILFGTAIASLGASLIPFGVSDGLALAGASMVAVYVVLTAGLLWSIPAFAAALLTGQSQSSGFAILQQATNSFAGAASAFSQLSRANQADKAAKADRQAENTARGEHAGYVPRSAANTGMAPGGPSHIDAQLAPMQDLNSRPDRFGAQADQQQAGADALRASSLYGIAQAAPREIGQPTAVQVRLSNPDRL